VTATEREDAILAHLDLVETIAWGIHRRCRLFDVDDLRSAGLVALVQGVDKFRPERGELRQWLSYQIRYGIIESARRRNWQEAAHLSLDAIQDTAAEDRFDMAPAAMQSARVLSIRPSEETMSRAVPRMVERALASLTARERQILHGLYWEERTQDDIAMEMGIHPTRISQYHLRALTKLRQAMGERLTVDVLRELVAA
jgi:RNA polymerase sigma factor (sigma-70 family)